MNATLSRVPAHPPSRRRLLRAGVAAALTAPFTPARAQAGAAPLDLVKVVTGFPAGSTSDVTCRNLADRLARDGYAKTAIVENRTGASGQLAIQFLKTQAPDGRTLLQTPMSMLGLYPHTYRKLPYDPVADVVPVTLACSFDFGIAVGQAVPDGVRSVVDLLAWFKANPSQANFGSPGAGSVPHFAGILMGRSAGISLTHIAYRGTQPAVLDVIGGAIPAAIGPIGDVLRLRGPAGYRVLASTGAARHRLAPELPTLAEQGYPDLVFSEWYGIFMPPGGSRATVERANAALRAAIRHRSTIEAFDVMGLDARESSPKELADLLRQDTERWAPIVKSTGFTVDS